jgi:hypothetical protein
MPSCFLIFAPSQSFQYERGSGSNPGPLPAVDIKKVQMREYQREHKARADQAKVNKNVAQDVQNIFNALTKTCVVLCIKGLYGRAEHLRRQRLIRFIKDVCCVSRTYVVVILRCGGQV